MDEVKRRQLLNKTIKEKRRKLFEKLEYYQLKEEEEIESFKKSKGDFKEA